MDPVQGCHIERVTESSCALARTLIRQGKLVVIPTDTVYGIACAPTSEQALESLFAAKRRPPSKSVQVLLSSLDELVRYGLSLPKPLDALAALFCPGGFSPICNADSSCPFVTVRRADEESAPPTQGVRIPASEDALRILAATGPLATSSANLSGGAAAQTVQEAAEAFGNLVALYLDGGPTPGPVASTVVKADPNADLGISILREGAVPPERITAALR